ncbi:rve domain-containing protein [Gossypium australe]|uniref:Rve domain-containing protein n=1 Tax=Gossypium australe TaxID=47621 RepID=A0A5B6VZW6_9ROSI|nr:rve domain-containing protein [Gossypium australe]
MESFLWKSIVCRFGVPRLIIIDNGTQFQGKFKNFCANLQIALAQSYVKTPQTNGQVEAMNKNILIALKKKVGDANCAWLEELPRIVWVLRSSPHTTIGETVFSLFYGAEVVIPAKIGMWSHKSTHFDEDAKLNLDLINEFREVEEIKNVAHAQQVARYYNSKVKNKQFQVGDLVLINTEASFPKSQ